MVHEGKAAFGVFHNETEINEARKELGEQGISFDKIEVLYPAMEQNRKGVSTNKSMIKMGVIIGGIIGGLAFLFVGLLVITGEIALPFLQQKTEIRNQILMVVLSIIPGVFFGAAAGALVGIGTPQRAGKRFADYVQSGEILMSVHVNNSDEIKKIKEVLVKTGADDVTLLDEEQSWDTIYAKVSSNK